MQKGRTGENRPDDCFFLFTKVTDEDWPRLVLEIGKIQRTESLEDAAEWWLYMKVEMLSALFSYLILMWILKNNGP
jgi:hypothetical protein